MTLQASSQQRLRQFIEQIERLEEEKRATAADITDKFLEAKAVGFDPKIMKKLLALRRKSQADRQEEDAVLETYMHALGMLEGTPMGDYLDRRDAADKLSAMAAEDGATREPTISVNGGPELPMSVVKQAVEIVKRSKGKARAST